jgi:hypothetical protein
MKIALITLILAGTAAAAAAAAERPAYAPKRLALVRQVTDVDASPDGKEAFFVTDITGAMELWKVRRAAAGRPS